MFSKLKKILFDYEENEEEVEIEKTEKKSEKKKDKKVEKAEKEEKIEEIKSEIALNDRDLFKAEPTFNFPNIDDTPFDKSSKVAIEDFSKYEPKIPTRQKKETPRYQEQKTKKKITPPRIETKPKDNPNKKFIPSPVISPVYGILDKNYKIEDIAAPKIDKPQINVDVVRRKAFGALEEDIEKGLPIPKKPKEEIDIPIEELLKSAVDDTIEVPDFNKTEENEYDTSFDIEEMLDKELAVSDKPLKEEEKNDTIVESEELEVLDSVKSDDDKEDDTLENDLFDLIDSMYESREDE